MRRAPSQTRSLSRSIVATSMLVLACAASTPLLAQQERQTPPAGRVPDAATEPRGVVHEPALIERAAIFADRHFSSGNVKNGWYLDYANMIPGAGWLSGGPGYRYWITKDSIFVDGSAALSWRGYKTAQARIELPKIARGRLAAGSQVLWQDFPQVNTYGPGPASLETNVSEYRLKSTDLVGYATLRPIEWLAVNGNIGRLQPSILPRAGIFKRDRPDTRDLFPRDAVFARDQQPAFAHREASIVADTRDFPEHPTGGGILRAAAAQYTDRDGGSFSFRRYELEGARFVPLADSRVVVALHGWLVGTSTTGGATVPFYLQPSLGGHNTLRSYADYRFHDRSLLAVTTEVRVAVMTHVDAAGFVDAGSVAARIGDLNFAKRSYGAGLRLHTRRQTFARLDVAHGDEGWRLGFRLTDPLRLSRIGRRSAAVPFVP